MIRLHFLITRGYRVCRIPIRLLLCLAKRTAQKDKEFAVGKLNGLGERIYAYTPNMKPGTYTVSLSINGRNFGQADYTPSANCTFQTEVKTLEGDCEATKANAWAPLLNQEVLSTPEAEISYMRCVTETSFYVYEDFDIAISGDWDETEFWGYSSGYDPGETTPRIFEVAVQVGRAEYVDNSRVCCFFMAPRNPLTAEVLEPYDDDGDDYADRMLGLPPVYDDSSSALFQKVFPREVPSQHSTYDICGGTFASLSTTSSGSRVVQCAAPPIPVWVDSEYKWTLRVTVNGQNHHGISTQRDALAAWDGLHGIEYYAKPCAAGYYIQVTTKSACRARRGPWMTGRILNSWTSVSVTSAQKVISKTKLRRLNARSAHADQMSLTLTFMRHQWI